MMTISQRRLALLGVGVGVLFLGGWSYSLHRKTQALEHEQQRLLENRARLVTQVNTQRELLGSLQEHDARRQVLADAVEARRAAEQQRQQAVREELKRLMARSEKPKKRRFPNPPSGAHGMLSSELSHDPTYARALTAMLTWQIEERYAGLLGKLTVEPSVLAKFKMLLLDWLMVEFDAENVAIRHNSNLSRENLQVANLRSMLRKEIQGEIRAVLGDVAYDQYIRYDKNSSSRMTLDALALRMSYSTEPLRPDQIAQLTEIFQGVPGWKPGMRSSGSLAIPEEKMARAQRVLSSAQFAQLQQFRVEQIASAAVKP
ncbi:MAG: hypothetical protein HZA31_05150 [Opitutae bacterium]|nr:hypothetical protein [Opitutae bacterium]